MSAGNQPTSERDERQAVAWGAVEVSATAPATESAPVSSGFYRRYGKRTLDLTLGVALFGLLLPVMIGGALAVLVFSGRPILYRAQRFRRDGFPFGMLKLRTMVEGAHDQLGDLLRQDPRLAAEYRSSLKLRDDPRRTRIGMLLRLCSIDELPQLWHVITGEMTLVGARPYALEEAPFVARHPEIFEMPPGITGPWQTGGRHALPPSARLSLDAAYVRDISFYGDLGYLAATLRSLVRPDGV